MGSHKMDPRPRPRSRRVNAFYFFFFFLPLPLILLVTGVSVQGANDSFKASFSVISFSSFENLI